MATQDGVRPRLLELFAGSKQLSQVAAMLGWDAVTLDNHAKNSPDICCDIRTWNFKNPRVGMFDYVHASIPCEEWSQLKTRGVRDFETARAVGQRTRAILDHFCKVNKRCVVTVENPATSLIQHEAEIVGGFRKCNTAYCAYAFPYRKATSIWTNLPSLSLKSCAEHCCWHGKHPISVQESALNLRAVIPACLCFDLLRQVMKHCRFSFELRMGGPPPVSPKPPPKLEERKLSQTQSPPTHQVSGEDRRPVGRPSTQTADLTCAECGKGPAQTSRLYNTSRVDVPLQCSICYRRALRDRREGADAISPDQEEATSA